MSTATGSGASSPSSVRIAPPEAATQVPDSEPSIPEVTIGTSGGIAMEYHEFLTYLFDRPQTRELAVELGVAMDERMERERNPDLLAG